MEWFGFSLRAVVGTAVCILETKTLGRQLYTQLPRTFISKIQLFDALLLSSSLIPIAINFIRVIPTDFAPSR
jgi:hypothetical protein